MNIFNKYFYYKFNKSTKSGLSAEDWVLFDETMAKKFPLRWKLFSTYRFINAKLYYYKMLLSSPYYYFINRFIDKSHYINTNLKKGHYHDLNDKLFHGNMSIIIEFVENNLSILDNNDYKDFPKQQILCEKYCKDIYNWYKYVYPLYDVSINALYQKLPKRKKSISIMKQFTEYDNDSDKSKANVLFEKIKHIQKDKENKEIEMLIKIAKIHHSLWF